ncbi:acyl carrier protein [bacterium]|nr:acyl carrier protein [bacterium]
MFDLSSENILKEIIAVINQTLEISNTSSSSEIGNPSEWDSLHHIQIMIEIENKFGVKIGAMMVAKLVSVKKISEFIMENKK